jgi:chemotaxis signal transduction protein
MTLVLPPAPSVTRALLGEGRSVRALLLPVDGELLAVPFVATREVVTAPAVTPVTGAPPGVLGLFALRGEAVPLLDAARLLGLGGPTPPCYAAVLGRAGRSAALAMTATPSILRVDEDDLRPDRRQGGTATITVRGPGRAAGLVATVLDLDEVLLAAGVAPLP